MSIAVWSRFVDFCLSVVQERSLFDAVVLVNIISHLDTVDQEAVWSDIQQRLLLEDPALCRWFLVDVTSVGKSDDERAAIAESFNVKLSGIQQLTGTTAPLHNKGGIN